MTTPSSLIPRLWRDNEPQLIDEASLRYQRHCRAFIWCWFAKEGTLRYRRAEAIMTAHATWLNAMADFMWSEIPCHCADAIVEQLAERGHINALPEKLWPQAYREQQRQESFLMKLATMAEELPMLV